MVAAPDFWDIGLFADGIPHDVFRRLRRDAPVTWNPGSDTGSGFWSLTRYDDIVRASRDSETFSSQRRGIMMFDTFVEGTPDDARMMIDLDPPLHTRYRRLVNRGFTPRTVARLDPLMRAVVTATIDAVIALWSLRLRGPRSPAAPAPVIAELLGIPRRTAVDRGAERPDSRAATRTGPPTRPSASSTPTAERAGRRKRDEMARGHRQPTTSSRCCSRRPSTADDPHRSGVRPVLPPARGRGQRDDARRHDERHGRLRRAPPTSGQRLQRSPS